MRTQWPPIDFGQQAPLRRLLAWMLIREAANQSKSTAQTTSRVQVTVPAGAKVRRPIAGQICRDESIQMETQALGYCR